MICTVEACLDTLKFDQYLLWFPPIWLVVSTPLKNYCSQLGWLFPIYGKIKNVPNHQPAIMLGTMLPLATLGMQTHPGLQEFPKDINHLQRRWRRWSDSHQPVGKLLQIIPNSCFHGGFLKTWRVFPSHHPYVWWIFHEINHPAIGNHPCFRNPPHFEERPWCRTPQHVLPSDDLMAPGAKITVTIYLDTHTMYACMYVCMYIYIYICVFIPATIYIIYTDTHLYIYIIVYNQIILYINALYIDTYLQVGKCYTTIILVSLPLFSWGTALWNTRPMWKYDGAERMFSGPNSREEK